MNLFGFEITRTRRKALLPVDGRYAWGWPWIHEPFAGAWQQNQEISVQDSLAYWAVFRCISMISSDVAKMELILAQRTKDDIWEKVAEDSPFWPVIRKPNKRQHTIQFYESWMQSRLSKGNAYILKARDARGIVSAMHVLDPTRVEVLVSDETGDVFYRLMPDNLSQPSEKDIFVPASEIIHDRVNTFFHELCGLSPLYAAGISALLGSRIQNSSAKFFGNNARPSGILTAPGAIDETRAQELKDYWAANFSGDNSGKVAIMGDGLKFEPMIMTATDAQLVDTLKWTDAMICGAFGVPAYMLNAGGVPAYNNVEALLAIYYSQCIQVHTEAIQKGLTEGLGLDQVPGKEYAARFELDDLLKMDTQTLIHSMKEGVVNGIIASNEARKRLNLPKVDGADVPMVQQQMWPINVLANRTAEDLPQPGGGGFGQGANQGGGNGQQNQDQANQDQQSEDSQNQLAALLLQKHLTAGAAL